MPVSPLCPPKMLSGANPFEISNIQESPNGGAHPGDHNVTMLHGPGRSCVAGKIVIRQQQAVIGVLIFPGLWSRFAYCAGFLLMIALTFGSTLRQDWTAAGWQLLYAFAYAALLAFREHSRYSVDDSRTNTVE